MSISKVVKKQLHDLVRHNDTNETTIWNCYRMIHTRHGIRIDLSLVRGRSQSMFVEEKHQGTFWLILILMCLWFRYNLSKGGHLNLKTNPCLLGMKHHMWQQVKGGYDDGSPLVVQVALLDPTSLKQVVKAIMTRMSTSANTTSRNGVHSLCIGWRVCKR
jgi:hypothetical protein